ncbi:MAG: two-component system nitrogen regulation sensor histidine kinase GlnL [Halieaceae bacterium]|jgi:two-component system nitrogen regulation sensor histidine kinase GlnL
MPANKNILDSISTGVIVLDPAVAITLINPAAQDLLHVSESRSLAVNAYDLLPRSPEWKSTLEQALGGAGTTVRRNITLFLVNGQEVHVDLFTSPLTPDEGGAGLIIEIQPVDRLLQIRRDQSIQQTQQSTRAVIKALAHEIKNPLAGVRGAAQLLARELPDESLSEYTKIIIQEADRLRDLVDRLLGSHPQLTLKPLNVHEVIEHVRNLLSAESDRQIRIDRDYDPSLPKIPGDKTQLIQAVLNIGRNALQAAKSPSQCKITLRTRSQRQFTIGTIRHRLVLRVDIIDNGPGIPEELQHSIFIPMVTGRADGTGLGLSIAQSIVNRHGGTLECESQPGQTRFTLFLPMEQ